MSVDTFTGLPYQAPPVFEIELEAIHDLYRTCFREVVKDIVAAGDSFSTGELKSWVEEKFYSKLKLERQLEEWFRASLDDFLSLN